MSQERAPASACATVADLLRMRAAETGERAWDFKLLYHQGELPAGMQAKGEDLAMDLTYAQLLACSERVAIALRNLGVTQGARVLLVLPTGLGWLSSFFACQLLGAVPVPLVPPWSVDHLLQHAERLAQVVAVCDASAAVVEPTVLRVLGATGSTVTERLRGLPRLGQSELFAVQDGQLAPISTSSDAPAFIQFTSGSTSEPKGVVISQRAALANCEFIAGRLGIGESDIGCAWLPLFHDMGLVGHVLAPLYSATPSVLFGPEWFARQPRVWLEAVSRYRATVTTAPSFAYDLCASRMSERDLEQLDLSSLRVAMCGGEPILGNTLRRFAKRFAPVGLRDAVLLPVYGLAETTLAVTLGEPASPLRVERIERVALEEQGRAVAAKVDATDDAVVELVGVGSPIAGEALRIVDGEGRSLPERRVGLIEAGGPSVMDGYFANPEATRAALRSGFVRTGDLGFMVGDQLFIVGRSKETIIKGGRNLYPYDIEAAAWSVDGIRKGRVVAFGSLNAETGTEDVVVVCETKVTDEVQKKQLERRVKAAVFGAAGLQIDALVLVAPGTLVKTSSGKLQRSAVRERFESGSLQPVRATWSLRAKAFLARKLPWLTEEG